MGGDRSIPQGGPPAHHNVRVPGELTPGLHEVLLTDDLMAEVERLVGTGGLVAKREELRAVEAPDRIALHLARLVERAVASVEEEERPRAGLRLARRISALIQEVLPASEASGDAPISAAPVLRALLGLRPDGTPASIEAPLIPLLDTALLTSSPGDPSLASQLSAEIDSADRIDAVIAFVRLTGIRPLLAALEQHHRRGRRFRLLTTTYTGSTEPAALERLRRAGAEIRVSYDTSTTRLHAKAWLFHRRSGFSTAYIGSSNLTHSAQVTGLEWNVRLAAARNGTVVDKVAAVFESYWESPDFVAYDPDEFAAATARLLRPGTTLLLSPLEVRLEPFQERLLEQLEVARGQGRHRNLLVSATGTGKTVMAAVDFARLRERLGRDRLLFVAHRDEILEQSRATFRQVLRDAGFGERWVGGDRPERFEHVFASVQSLASSGVGHLSPDHFDVVVVDEFHHAAAPTYVALLDRLRPAELLGLTATPERSDGLDVLGWFGGRIAAELRLWDAIDQHRLTPFHYFGVPDGLDLRQVPWRRGSGYDVAGLTALYTANDLWAHRVIAETERRLGDLGSMRALGFCVSVDHARFMARVFGEAGLASAAVTASTPVGERRAALAELAAGRLRAVFSVDVFNEGVDVPVVDTLLLLRPTDSPTLFLQQLGRGLRRAPGKEVCTVLDFIGQHRREYRLDRRYRALLGGTRGELEAQIEQRFPFLPAGCHLELDPVATDLVLAQVRSAVPDPWSAKVDELVALTRRGRAPTLRSYLEETGLELEEIYQRNRCWSDLRSAAGLPVLPPGPAEVPLRRALGRLLHVDDGGRLLFWRSLLAGGSLPRPGSLSEGERRLVRMLVASLARTVLGPTDTLDDALAQLWAHPQVRAELVELLDLLEGRVEHLQAVLAGRPEVPLRVHARYTRDEMLAGFGIGGDGGRARVAPWQTGVRFDPAARVDLLAITLDKTGRGFSPTTRYRDYAVSRYLVHWESQGVTRASSETGRRYQHHRELGTSVMLFARLRPSDRAFWFLGPAGYVSHEGERPMAITWRLEHPLPGDLFARFAAAVA